MTRPDRLSFGPFRLDPVANQLWRGTKPIALQPQPLAVLSYLATHGGRVVSSAELLAQAWNGAHVSRTALKVCVHAIRAALGDDADKPRYIETVGREGYRFLIVGNVAQQDDDVLDESPVVARDEVAAALERAAERAKRGERQLVFVTGEPGIGKTTVVDRFVQRVGATPLVSIGRGQCLEQYGEGEAYLPVLEALGQICRAPGARAVLEVLRAHAPTWLAQMPGLVAEAELEALQRRIGGANRERMLREMAQALDVLTAERSLVLVLEDLHWSDRSTVELLAYVAQRREGAKLLIVGTYRPVELIVREHPLLDIQRGLRNQGRSTELALELLAEADVVEYLTRRLGKRRASLELARQLYRRTDGNPLFLVNLLDDLLARGPATAGGAAGDAMLEEGAVPDSVQQTISRQIARRSPAMRSVLEAASVVGAEFSAAAVAACLELEPEAVEAVCEDLVREAHFLREAGVQEWRDGTVTGKFAFRHVLYQQVLYQQIAASRRIRLHRRIGEREERGHADRAGEIAARLASHFTRGRDLERAAQYLRRAGENAMRRSAYFEAIAHFSEAIELLRALPPSAERAEREFVLQERLASSLLVTKGANSDEVLAPATRALELSSQMRDAPELIALMDGLRGIYLTRGDLRSARALAERTLAIAQRGTDVMQLGTALYGAGTIALFRGDFVVAKERLGQIVAFAPTTAAADDIATLHDPLVIAKALYAGALWFTGFPDSAARYSQEALSEAERLAHPLTLANVQLFATIVHLGRDEVEDVRRNAEASLLLGTEHGFTTIVPSVTILAGWALARQNQVKRGLAQMRKGFAEYEATSGALFQPWFLAVLAQGLSLAGRIAEADESVDRAIAASDRTGERTCEAELYRMKGELHLAASQAVKAARGSAAKRPDADAEACFAKAIETARRHGAKSWELRGATSMSRLQQRQGRKKEARDALADVYGWFTEGFDTPDLSAAKTLLESLD